MTDQHERFPGSQELTNSTETAVCKSFIADRENFVDQQNIRLGMDRYRETKVEVSLKGVSLPQTVAYLHEIEGSGELLTVKSLRLRTRADKPELLDVVFTVSSFERI